MGQCQYCNNRPNNEAIDVTDSPIKQNIHMGTNQTKLPYTSVSHDEPTNALYRVRSTSLPSSTSSDSGCDGRAGLVDSLDQCSLGDSLGSFSGYKSERVEGAMLSYLDLPVYDECSEDENINISTSIIGSARSLGKNSSEQGSSMGPISNRVYDISSTKKPVNRSISLNLNKNYVNNYSPKLLDDAKETKHSKRSLSLRLTQKYRPKMVFNKSPQNNNSPNENENTKFRQKIKQEGALSILSATAIARQITSIQETKPDPKKKMILRQPRRRHNTVRGVSGMAIDGSNQDMGQIGGLQRSHTVYCPTKTSLKYKARRTTSINT